MATTRTGNENLGPSQRGELLAALKARFEGNMHRHKGLQWARVRARLESKPDKLWSLSEMEGSGGDGDFDTKTSSWLQTPPAIRSLGGAIFGDSRYGTVFIYHNGAESYYAARGFRCVLRV